MKSHSQRGTVPESIPERQLCLPPFNAQVRIDDGNHLIREIPEPRRRIWILDFTGDGVDIGEHELQSVPGSSGLGDVLALRADLRHKPLVVVRRKIHLRTAYAIRPPRGGGGTSMVRILPSSFA